MAWGGWSPRFHQMNTECSIGEGGVCVGGLCDPPSEGTHDGLSLGSKKENSSSLLIGKDTIHQTLLLAPLSS